jgi:glycosyltransferase involved in cell wall biosynthesis
LNSGLLLTIAIPTYNRVNKLKRLLNNILDQSFSFSEEIELMISNNCSSDETSQFLETRNYIIDNQMIEPNVTLFLFKNQLRILTSYKYDIRKNAILYGGEKSTSNNINIDLRYNIISSGNMNLKTTYSSISYNATSNSTIGYIMLDGLQKGSNWLWQISFEKRISKNIEMSLQYEGRKPASTTIIHTGRASVRAIF